MAPSELLTFLVAIIGAGAWLPHIIKWCKEKNTIASIVLIPDGQVDIGYSSYGAMFNLNVAIATSKKDIIINQIKTILKHEKGDTHTFLWQGLNETMGELSNTSGERVIQTKDQAAIALKLVTTSLAEKFIRFQEEGFVEKYKVYQNKLANQIEYINKNKIENSKILETKEFFDLIEFFKTNFWWKPGKYTVTFSIKCLDKFEFDNRSFEFELPKHELENLKNNIKSIKLFLSYVTQGNLGSLKKELHFHWPKLNLSNKIVK